MNQREIDFETGGRRLSGVIFEAEAEGARPGVLVLHGGAGRGGHELERARTLAELGYTAFAPDLFGETFGSREQGIAVITRLLSDTAGLRARLAAALHCLRSRPKVDGDRMAAIGYCFGGMAALELARSGADLRAAVSFHGGLTTNAPAEPGRVKASVLVCTGAADPFVTPEHRAAIEAEMTRAGADWQVHLYASAVHGFTERPAEGAPPRPGCAYNEAADRRSWAAMLSLFNETFGARST